MPIVFTPPGLSDFSFSNSETISRLISYSFLGLEPLVKTYSNFKIGSFVKTEAGRI